MKTGGRPSDLHLFENGVTAITFQRPITSTARRSAFASAEPTVYPAAE
ncbi:MAG: hypothetical protein ABIP85_22265 [Chthoniobacteraceae bacterium]